jgi:hypothetical protein
VEEYVVAADGVSESPAHVREGVLERLVDKGLDPAAVVADEVVVMVAAGANGLVAGDTFTEVESLHESELGENVEHPVDAGNSHRPTLAAQGVEDLLRAEQAVLAPQ